MISTTLLLITHHRSDMSFMYLTWLFIKSIKLKLVLWVIYILDGNKQTCGARSISYITMQNNVSHQNIFCTRYRQQCPSKENEFDLYQESTWITSNGKINIWFKPKPNATTISHNSYVMLSVGHRERFLWKKFCNPKLCATQYVQAGLWSTRWIS